MSTHSICFHEGIRKISILFYLKKNALSGMMFLYLISKHVLMCVCVCVCGGGIHVSSDTLII